MNQETKLDVLIYEEDMQQINDKIIVPSEIGQLTQSIVDIALRRQKEYYQEIIEYLLDALEEEHMDSRIAYTRQLKEEFNYELNY